MLFPAQLSRKALAATGCRSIHLPLVTMGWCRAETNSVPISGVVSTWKGARQPPVCCWAVSCSLMAAFVLEP